jgi:hypothetical protein
MVLPDNDGIGFQLLLKNARTQPTQQYEYQLPPASQPAALHRALWQKHSDSSGSSNSTGTVSRLRINVLSYNVFLRMFPARDPATSSDNDFKEKRMQSLVSRLDTYDILLLQGTGTLEGNLPFRSDAALSHSQY